MSKSKGPLLQDTVFETDCQVYIPDRLDISVYITPQPVPLQSTQQHYSNIDIHFKDSDGTYHVFTVS